MSEKTRSVKTKDVTSEEAEAYLLQVSAHLNEIKRLEEEKSEYTKSLNAQIKTEEDKLEKIRVILNEGVIITLHNFMDKDTHEIVWKDDNGDEVERTPFDEQDWEIWEKQYGPKQGTLFNDEEPAGTMEQIYPSLNVGNIIDAESENITDGQAAADVEAERDAL